MGTAALASRGKRDPDVRRLGEQALARASGAPLLSGNQVHILRDAEENYPAWLDAITVAEQRIHFENYIIHDDAVGQRFAEALAAKARDGVTVRLIYDWLGCVNTASRAFWRELEHAGVEVRCFNPPKFDSPFGWLSRDHRKMLTVDGEVGFLSGLCLGEAWEGNPSRGIEPWRDTGAALRGPAVADLERAFNQVWSEIGSPLPPEDLPLPEEIAPAGAVDVRILLGRPSSARVYRLDQLIASLAERTLWLTDAYFIATPAYLQSLRSAAKDGVDVRLLIPGASDVALLKPFSQAGYRPLLEAGVRVFEWNGPMLHAKTAVADGRWARVGSSNLNISSWIGNYELDLAAEDEGIARTMEAMYERDLTNATEVVLGARNRLARAPSGLPRSRGTARGRGGSMGQAAAGALRIANTIGAALTTQRVLGPTESRMLGRSGAALLAVSAIAVIWPRIFAVPLGIVGAWVGASLLLQAIRLRDGGKPDRLPPP